MEDNRDFIRKAHFQTKGKIGRELSPSEMASEFALMGLQDRVNYLDSIDAENASGEPISIRGAARRVSYERALRNTHEALRKADR